MLSPFIPGYQVSQFALCSTPYKSFYADSNDTKINYIRYQITELISVVPIGLVKKCQLLLHTVQEFLILLWDPVNSGSLSIIFV